MVVVGMTAAGVENENVGRARIDGSTVPNETVGRKAIVDTGTAVVVGEMVGMIGTEVEVAGREVGVLGITPDEHPNKITA
jgi:hypothetical protein